jgi:hypothetical protein
MNFYRLIGGFETHAEATGYAARLPKEARARVVPYMVGKDRHLFAVDVDRFYTGGRT